MAPEASLGDARSLTALYNQHHVALRNFACRLLGEPNAAEDLVHDVFIDLPKALRRYRGDCSMTTFLRAMAIHRAQRHLRAASRRRKAMERLAQANQSRAASMPEEIRRRELQQRLSEAMDQLSLAHRAAFVLCEVEELSTEEAAQVLNIPAATVRTRVFYARRKLAELLGGVP